MRLRRSVVAVVLTAGVLVPVVSTAAVASASVSSSVSASAGAVHAAKKAKPVKRVKFSASGLVTGVDANGGTLTVAGKGATITVLVPATARIVLRDARVALSAVPVGGRVTVTGTRVGTVYTATRVQAKAPRPVVTPTPSPTPSVPSDDLTDEPTTEPSDD